MMANKLKVLVVCDYYLPGFRAGGPQRSISNLVRCLSADIQFKIITRDRDIGSSVAYDTITDAMWQTAGDSDVAYIAPSRTSLLRIGKRVRQTDHDILYINSFFSPWASVGPLLLRRLRIIPCSPLVVAPRGEFSPEALNMKSRKKRWYLRVARALGLHRDVHWQATSTHELEDIRRHFEHAVVAVVPNVPEAFREQPSSHQRLKRKGLARVVFLSRISPMKNLDGAIRMLREVRQNVELDIYGPMEDRQYWNTCLALISQLPANVEVTYQGVLNHSDVFDVLAAHDVFFCPTLGENFGHVIFEALHAGCPVLISDQTPWKNLASQSAGWEFPLSNPERFVETIDRVGKMGEDELRVFREGARALAREYSKRPDIGAVALEMFRSAKQSSKR